jgi:hypothetical protein
MLASLRKWAAESVDARDLVLVCGLALLSIGLWAVFPPAAAIVPGAVLTYVAIFGVKAGD